VLAASETTSFEIPADLEPLFPARVVSGVQPSGGGMHLGNYFGAVREHTRLQYEYPGDAFYLIADYHALTTQRDAEALLASTSSIAVDYLALGLDPTISTLYRQSDVPQVCELMWILACATRKSRLDQAHAYRAATDKGELPSVGLFLYPELMAADILALRGTDVPVGNDQQQHLEIARDVARAFNQRWAAVFPTPSLRDTLAPMLPGVDGQKMSKSYGNVLPVFWSDEEDFEARVMHIVTDSAALGEPINPERSPVFALYRLVAAPGNVEEMREGLACGRLGYREAKRMLLQALHSYFSPYRERRRELEADGSLVEEVLRAGALRAREEAEATLDAVRDAVGLATYRRRAL
jgi:tryptophanyl-tRNA synthetase